MLLMSVDDADDEESEPPPPNTSDTDEESDGPNPDTERTQRRRPGHVPTPTNPDDEDSGTDIPEPDIDDAPWGLECHPPVDPYFDLPDLEAPSESWSDDEKCPRPSININWAPSDYGLLSPSLE